jgi:UDP-MurNAc hydroxylase
MIESADLSVLCDPWFTEGAYDGSWFHFPRLSGDPMDILQECDFIYISNVLPDHYDVEFLRRYLKRYPKSTVVIADFLANTLAKQMNKDRIPYEIVNELHFGSTMLKLFPCHSNPYDIHSALVVKDDTSSVVNMNDNPFHEAQLKRIKSFAPEIDLALLPYFETGAYPQTYYAIEDHRLKERSLEQEAKGVQRYLEFANYLNPEKNIPFAGSHVLGGRVAFLNRYRGMVDATRLLEVDPKAIVLDDGGRACYDTVSMSASSVRTDPYDQTFLDQYILQITNHAYEYESTLMEFDVSIINFKKLLDSAYTNALTHSVCASDHFYCFYIDNEYFVMNVNPKKREFKVVEAVDSFSPRSEVYMDTRYLYGLIKQKYQWQHAQAGSHLMIRQYPDCFDEDVQSFMNALFVT